MAVAVRGRGRGVAEEATEVLISGQGLGCLPSAAGVVVVAARPAAGDELRFILRQLLALLLILVG